MKVKDLARTHIKERFLKYRNNSKIINEKQFIDDFIKYQKDIVRAYEIFKIEGYYKDNYYQKEVDIFELVDTLNKKGLNDFEQIPSQNKRNWRNMFVIQYPNFRTEILAEVLPDLIYDKIEKILIIDEIKFNTKLDFHKQVYTYLINIKVRYLQGENLNEIILKNKKRKKVNKNSTVYNFFDEVRNDEFAETDILKSLKDLSEDFNMEILKSIRTDLEFYLHTEREKKESEYNSIDINNAIEQMKSNGLEIPYLKKTQIENLTKKQIENRKSAEEKGFDFDAQILNKEQLLFPFEFYSLYRLRDLISEKLKNENSDKFIKSINTLFDNQNASLDELTKRYEQVTIEQNLNSTKQKDINPKRLTAPVIIAMLKELGVFGVFNKKGFGRNAIVDTLYHIIGTNKTNIAEYYDSLNSNDQDKFNESHIKKAKDFLNSKGL